jgi:hypothetical protein
MSRGRLSERLQPLKDIFHPQQIVISTEAQRSGEIRGSLNW